MIRFQENVSLAGCVAYKIGGHARYFFNANTVEGLFGALKFAKEKKIKIFILGEGTNLLVGDKGFKGLVIHPDFKDIASRGAFVEVGAGISMKELVSFAITRGLSGLEWAGGLPGSVGGAIRGNAGAFGGEIKDSVIAVKSVDTVAIKEKFYSNSMCKFGYRSSIFKLKKEKDIVISVIFKLKKGNMKVIRKATMERIIHRKKKHPLEFPNVGSIFKNVDVKKVSKALRVQFAHVIKKDPFPVIPAACLISEAGMKGVRVGDAEISTKHPNFIINKKKATADDVKKLIACVTRAVDKKFNVVLEAEVQILD
ncbi:MAG: UDP-N-acetylmuramate dehydrogenase [Patescibacteria group bacterium]|nr:UDP-N-acetylmuramate dehydrogenase [Patescibacteria group bacterium]